MMWAVCAYIFAGCGGGEAAHHDHDHEHEEAHHHEHEEHEHEEAHHHEHEGAHVNEIIFKEEKAKAVGLQTKVMTPAPFTEVIKTSGSIVAAQGDEVTVVATAPGIVTLGSARLVDGSPVKKGQALLSLVSDALPEGNVVVKAKAAYEAARKEYERMQQLVGDKIVSAKEFEEAKMNYENAKTAYEAVAGKETAGGVSVLSPLKGCLKDIRVKEGDYVAVGQPLMTISQNNRLVLRAEVSEKYYRYLPFVRSANFRTPYDERVYRLSDLHGRLLSYGKASDSDSFYVPVTFEFDNKGSIIPGSFVEIYLLANPMEGVLSVPVSAIIEEQGVCSVYVRLDEDGYRKQEVTTGASNGCEVQILSGLKQGDEVVTEGAYQIKLASASNAIPAHTHHH